MNNDTPKYLFWQRRRRNNGLNFVSVKSLDETVFIIKVEH